MSGAEKPIEALDVAPFATRQSTEFDEVVRQADYAARAAISFFRFRQLGGGRGSHAGRIQLGRLTHGRGVHYVSDHPQVRMLSLSVIALLILFESAANAYFFAQQSEFGLFGGLFQAAAVSLANVATSYFIIGYWGLRHASMPTSRMPKRDQNGNVIPNEEGLPNLVARGTVIKIGGFIAMGVGAILVLLVNLSAAHYRNILDLRAMDVGFPEFQTATFPRFLIDSQVCADILNSEIGQTIGSAATNAMCRPFALHSLDAMVLFALGIAISALAIHEGRRADAAYPGFSDAARQFERARVDLQYALDDYYDSYEDIVERLEETLDIEKANPPQKLKLRAAMDDAVAPYKHLLTTHGAILGDEFQVSRDIVTRIAEEKSGDDFTPAGETQVTKL
ncbi:MAG: hypothetical protein AAGJ84_08830 [Pseudomonadota bacterium]